MGFGLEPKPPGVAMGPPFRVFLAAAGPLLLLDHATKSWVRDHLPVWGS
jgi:hypothetical protein